MGRILIIEEEPGNRLILQSRFGEQGHEVVSADNGAGGLMEARSSHFDVVLVSAGLKGGVRGPEVCRRLKKNPQTVHLPVVVFQAQAGRHDDALRSFEAGCEAFVSKSDMPLLDEVVKVMSRIRGVIGGLHEEKRSLEDQTERLRAEVKNLTTQEGDGPTRDPGENAAVLRELATGRPEGLVVVDSEGYVRHADRGACEIFGQRIEGQKLGSLAPASGLEAFARDARIETRDGFRFELPARKGRPVRPFGAVVVPIVTGPEDGAPGYRIVLLQDMGRRRLAADLLKVQEPGLPRSQAAPLMEAAREVYHPGRLLGACEEMVNLREQLASAADGTGACLLSGERGTGKERVARTLHFASGRTGAFVQISCTGQSPEVLAGELFGRAKEGDKAASRPGLMQVANEGTLLLQNVADLPQELQERLLRVIEDRSYQREGGRRKERAEVRILAASHVDLSESIAAGRFSRALYDALRDTHFQLAPLRDRCGDISLLAREFLNRFGSARGVTEIAPQALSLLELHEWPGNVAELEDCIEHVCAQAPEGAVQVEDLPRHIQDLATDLPDHEILPSAPPEGRARDGSGGGVDGSRRLGWVPKELRPWDITDDDPISLDHYEKKALLRALNQVGGDKLAAARLLNVGKSTLYRKLKRFNIT